MEQETRQAVSVFCVRIATSCRHRGGGSTYETSVLCPTAGSIMDAGSRLSTQLRRRTWTPCSEPVVVSSGSRLVVPGQEGLDHPSHPGAGEQQTGSGRPGPGKMAVVDQSGLIITLRTFHDFGTESKTTIDDETHQKERLRKI